MKKLLGVISSATLMVTLPINVVSCSSNKKFTEFKKWISNEESFILLLGSDEDDKTKDLETIIKVEDKKFNDSLQQLNNSYNVAAKNDNKHSNDSKLGFGKELKSKIEFKTLKSSKKEINFKEKWSENLIKWMVDEITPILEDELSKNYEPNKKIIKATAKKYVKTYFKDKKDIPMFLLVRNGKLIGWEIGFSKEERNDKKTIDNIFEKFTKIFVNDNQESVIISAILEGKKNDKPEEDKDKAKPMSYTIDSSKMLNYFVNK